MIADRARTDAYAQALRQAVTPQSVVLDIGSGPGIFSLLACQFGARMVYALEPKNVIALARQIAIENGYGDRIQFLQQFSTRATLPERADILISDIHGVLPLFQFLPSVIDARRRLLTNDCKFIPRCETLWAAIVEAKNEIQTVAAHWEENPYGLKMNAARTTLANCWWKERFSADQILTQPTCWATLDYANVADPDVSSEIAWIAEKSGTAHGLAAWFDSELGPGVEFSNAPGQPDLIYGHAFFPWLKPVRIEPGDTIRVKLEAKLIGEDYVWRWDTHISTTDKLTKADFRQSTFYTLAATPTELQRFSPAFVPALSDDALTENLLLDLFDGQARVDEIAAIAFQRFPDRFGSLSEALVCVSQLARRCSR